MLEAITLLGSSSGRNAGDAALMSGLMDTVDDACGERLLYEIPTIKPAFIRSSYANRTRPVGMMPWNLSLKMLGAPTWRSVMRTDLTLVFDAILFDRELYNPLFNFLSSLYLILPRARKRGKRIAGFDVGVGPVDTPAGRRMLRDVAELMEFITVRDQESLDILADAGVQHPRVLLAADAAVNVRPAAPPRVAKILHQAGLEPGEDLLGININRYLDTWARPRRRPIGKDRFLEIMAAAIRRTVDRIGCPVLLVCTQHHDVEISRELAGRLAGLPRVGLIANTDHSHYEIKGVLGACSLVFAMRLHASILGASALAPIVGLAYQPKVEFFYRALGLEPYCLGFDGFDESGLSNHLFRGWSERQVIRSVLQERIPHMQHEARMPAELVAAMRRGDDLDRAFQALARSGGEPA